jgi:uridine kinase
MQTRIVAVDGPGGAGKSTFASLLAAELGGAQIVHTDDFASWDDPLEWWPRACAELLEPLAQGCTARFERSRWTSEQQPEQVEVAPAEVVLFEGVTSSREAFRAYLTYAIWIETPRVVRLERGVARDGEGARDDWVRWMAAEDEYVRLERPAERADLVLRGDLDLWT